MSSRPIDGGLGRTSLGERCSTPRGGLHPNDTSTFAAFSHSIGGTGSEEVRDGLEVKVTYHLP